MSLREFYAPYIGAKLKFSSKPSPKLEKASQKLEFDFNQYYMFTVNRYSKEENKYVEDPRLLRIVSSYYDVEEIKKFYLVTQNNFDDTMKDYAKYYRNSDFVVKPGVVRSIRRARQWLLWYKKTVIGAKKPRYLEFDEIIEHLMNKTSASSFPFSLVAQTKGEIFEQEWFRECYFAFRKRVLDLFDVPLSLWSISFKEEIRPSDKVKIGKVRSFLSGALLLLILGHERCFDLDYLMSLDPFKSLTGVGLNPFYGTWDRFIKFNDGFTGDLADISKWDSGIFRFLSEAAYEVNAILYQETEYDRMIRHRLNTEASASYNICPSGDVLYKVEGENSGNFRTLSDNNDFHRLILFGAFIHATNDDSAENFKWYMLHSHDWIQGDDGNYLKDREFYDRMKNLDYLYDFFKELNFEIEHEGNCELQSADMTFLGMKTVVKEGYYVPRPNFVKILAGLIQKNKPRGLREPDLQLQRLCMVRIMSYTHDEEFVKIDHIVKDFYEEFKNDDNVKKAFDENYLSELELRSLWYGRYEGGIFSRPSRPEPWSLPNLWTDTGALDFDSIKRFADTVKVNYQSTQVMLNYQPRKFMSYAYHGNYCGPGWSAGKRQNSVVDNSVSAIDEFDQTCLEHDASYALDEDLKEADEKFFSQNIGKGFKRSLAALLVGAQGMSRRRRNKKGAKVAQAVKKVEKSLKKEIKRDVGKVAAVRAKSGRARSGNAARIRSAPVATFSPIGASRFKTTTRGNDSSVCNGSDFLVSLSSGSTGYNSGDIIYSFEVYPSNFPNSRLRTFNALYEKYIIEQMDFEYRNSCPTSVSGALLFYVDRDPSDTVISGDDGIRRAMTVPGNKTTAVWQPVTCSMHKQASNGPLFTSGSSDARWQKQGKFVVLCMSSIPPNTTLGFIKIHYRVRFFVSHLDVLSTITNQSAYYSSGPVPGPCGDVKKIQGDYGIVFTNTNGTEKGGRVTTITFPEVGVFSFTMVLTSNATFALNKYMNFSTSNLTVVHSHTPIYFSSNVSGNSWVCWFACSVTAPGGILKLWSSNSSLDQNNANTDTYGQAHAIFCRLNSTALLSADEKELSMQDQINELKLKLEMLSVAPSTEDYVRDQRRFITENELDGPRSGSRTPTYVNKNNVKSPGF